MSATPAQKRASELRKKYDMTPDDWERLFELQGGMCAVCDKPFGDRRPHVDHDHHSGRVRGLLCFYCNHYLVAKHEIGKIARLMRVKDYLKNPPAFWIV